ncbi:MAG: FG-GAP-like repeat-containing protein [Prevotella sp.]|nr:FG-GAP-like repeat-containing protein [Prevotella sp.]
MTGRYILKLVPCLLFLFFPANIQAASICAVHPGLVDAPNDSLQSGKPFRSAETDGQDTEESDGFITPTNPTTPIDPTTPWVPIDPLVPIDPRGPAEPWKPHAGYSVGTPNGTLSVNKHGAAVYDLRIDVPYGGSLTPEIGLSYNSQSAGYGLAGFGFNLTGISAITRVGHDLFHDGRLQGVTYGSSDNLLLDGKRLVLQSGTPGQDGAAYTVEGDPFTKVVLHGNYNGSEANAWFEVTTGTGMTYQYGKYGNSRIIYNSRSGQTNIAAWYVNEAADRYSNRITYEYDITSLFARPAVITYGINSVKNRGIVNKIKFSYKSLKGNTRPFAIEDRQGKADACLASITSTSNDSVYRKYIFNYDETSDQSHGKWTRLTSVMEYNGRGEKFLPIGFGWQHLPSPEVYTSQLDVSTKDDDSLVEETGKQFLASDLNGDGVSDIIRVSTAKTSIVGQGGKPSRSVCTKVYISRSKVSPDGSISYCPSLTYILPTASESRSSFFRCWSGGASAMDYDGDGYNDLVIPFLEGAGQSGRQATFYVIGGSDVAAGRGYVFNAVSVDLKSTDKAALFVAFDLDGDGRDDLVSVEQGKNGSSYPCTVLQYAGASEPNRTEMKLTLPQGVNKDIGKVFTGDYNNDGLTDLILLYEGGYKIYFNNGGNAASSAFTEGSTKAGTDLGDCWRIQQGDFDGDGLSDFVYNKAGATCLWIAHNNGDGTFTHTKSADIGMGEHATNKDNGRFSIVAYDIDHDGLTDVMACKAGYKHRGFPNFENVYTDTQVRWLYSTGTGLKTAYSYAKNREDDAVEGYIFLGDFDGDGYPELANYGSRLNGKDDTFNERINVYKLGNDLSQVGKITSITDGMGNTNSIQYASCTNPSVYRRKTEGSYPANTYTLPLSVVSWTTADNGSAGPQQVKYFYEDLRLHVAGKGMLGFNSVTAENTTLGTKEKNTITKWDGSLWIPMETRTESTVGSGTGTTVSTISISKNGGNYFAFVSKRETTDLDGNRTTVLSNYDVSKGVLVDETVRNDGDNMYKKVTYAGYQNKAGAWVPATLTMTQKHADDPAPHTTVTAYSYDNLGNVLASEANSGTDMALRTVSTYDAYGNVLSSVSTGKNVKAVTRYNEYDPSGRFVTKAYTSPASAVSTFTYDQWGNVLTESDATDPSCILTTRYTYDGWGRRLTALRPDSTRTVYETGWSFFNNTKYYTKETSTGKPSVTIGYDKGGNEVSWRTTGPKDIAVSRTTTYNKEGKISQTESKTGELAITQKLTYDERGRVLTDELSSGRSVSYSYGNRSVTTTIAGRSYTKTTDAWGNVVKATDPASEVHYQYSSIGKPRKVTASGSTVTMAYDVAGNQVSLSDPDAGTSNYTYAADGTLLTQTDGRGVRTTNSYDNLGRLASSRIGQETITYTYGATGNERLRLSKVSTGNNTVEYTHDRLGRVVAERRNVDGHGTYAFSYTYNGIGQLAKTRYPGGLEVAYLYDGNGFKTQTAIGDKVIYKVENADGLVSSASFLGKLTTTRTRDGRGFERNVRITRGDDILESFDEDYDGATGNLLSRRRNNGPQEEFVYDGLDRLVSVGSGGGTAMGVDYAPNGNILFKTGVGNFFYDRNVLPHAVAEVENADGSIPSDALTTTFNDFGKIGLMADAGKGLRMDFGYGPDRQRWYSELLRDGKRVRTTVYAGEYEKIEENGKNRWYYYLDGNTIVIKQNGIMRCYLAFTDNLGSILSVRDENGKKVFDASYDAWGRQTVTLNTIGLHRGYTGHEMLSEFDIINMNGRLYDPVLGRFLSPDNYVQAPESSQSFNRYSYCMNNPLKYVDPSGNLFGIDDAIIAFAAFNMASGMMRAAFDGKSVWKAGALSLLSSAASYGIGELFKGTAATFGNELLRAGAHGLASGVASALDGGSLASAFVSGAAASGIGSYAQVTGMNRGLMVISTTAMGGAVAWATGGEFLQGALQGMNIGIFNHAMHEGGQSGVVTGDGGPALAKKLPGHIFELVDPLPVLDVVASRATGIGLLDVVAGTNTVLNGIGASLKSHGGNSTIGSSGKVYWHGGGQRGFYGNQYVSTMRLTSVGRAITKHTGPIGIATSIYDIGDGMYVDYQTTGSLIGYKSVRASASAVGGWAGGWAGLEAGAMIGGSIGVSFGGVGAVPGAVIGGIIGGVGGAIGGSAVSEFAVDKMYGIK